MPVIRIREPLGTFLYFFCATCFLAWAGRIAPALTDAVGEIMQEHIAGKTIKISSMLALFMAFACACRNFAKQREYGRFIEYLVINPSNFVISLAFVAAAVNWGVALSSYFLVPPIIRGSIFHTGLINALEITGIAAGLLFACWALHQQTSARKGVNDIAFWIVFASSAIFWSAGTYALLTRITWV